MTNLCIDQDALQLRCHDLERCRRGQRNMQSVIYLSKVSKEKTLRKCDRQFVFQAQWREKKKKNIGKEEDLLVVFLVCT